MKLCRALLLLGVALVWWSPFALPSAGDAAAARARLQPDRPPLRYTLEADVDFTNAYVTALQRTVWRNVTSATLNEIVFNVTPARYRAFKLLACAVDGQPCAPALSGVVMEVPLPRSLPPGETVTIDLRYFLDVPEPGNLRFGKAGGILALGNWYPTLAVYREGRLVGPGRTAGWDRHPYTDVGDAFYTEAADYDVTVRTNVPVVTAHTGRPDPAFAGGELSARYVGSSLRDFALAFSDRYEVTSTEVNGTTIAVFAPAGHARGAETALQAAAATLRFMEANVGPYAWSALHIAETANFPQSWDGQEYSGLTFISAHHMANPGPPGSYLWYLVAHEVVHQWFYAAVGNDQLYDPWLDEAPATQLAWLTLRSVSPGAYTSAWETLKARWSAGRAAYGDRSVGTGIYDYTTANESAYFAVVYRKGALFLDEVRLALGDDAYFAMLREYYATYLYRVAMPADFFAAVKGRLGDAGEAIIARYFD